MEDILESGLSKLGISFSTRELDLCKNYLTEVERWNKRFSLVNASGRDLLIRHLLDSLAALPVLKPLERSTIGDIGSGAGFPGIPLGIFLEDTSISLLERSENRCIFLRNVVLDLGLNNVSIVKDDFTQWNGCFDITVLRALKPLSPKMVKTLLKITCAGGYVCTYKGKRKTLESEMYSCRELKVKYDILKLNVPFLHEERHLILIKQEGSDVSIG